jgi:hypothetical protein
LSPIEKRKQRLFRQLLNPGCCFIIGISCIVIAARRGEAEVVDRVRRVTGWGSRYGGHYFDFLEERQNYSLDLLWSVNLGNHPQ